MSPTTSHPDLDSSGHLPVETIADYLEDLLPPDTATRIEAHLADCPECLDTRAALEEVRSLLGQTDTPVLPEDIALRIDAALAAEARTQAESLPQSQSQRESQTRAGTTPGKGHSAPSTPPAGPRGSTGPGRRGVARWRRFLRGAVALSAAGLIVTAVVHMGGSESKSGSSASGTSVVSGPKYDSASIGPFTAAGFAQQIRTLLASPTPDALGHPKAERSPEAGSRASAPPAAPGRPPATPARPRSRWPPAATREPPCSRSSTPTRRTPPWSTPTWWTPPVPSGCTAPCHATEPAGMRDTGEPLSGVDPGSSASPVSPHQGLRSDSGDVQ